MNFERVLQKVLWRLVTEGSISYRRIKLSFGLDHDGLEELRRELIGIKRVAADVDGEVLVWAPEGRVARPEPTALLQPLPAMRQAERPAAPAIERELPAAAPVVPAAVAAAPDAERRQLTVMFCDLVGSTALSTGMDPEDLRDVIASYQSRCSAAIRHYDGFVAKYIGDGTPSETAVVGETPNLAARLQALAQPNQILVSAATRGILGDHFDLADL